MNVSLLYVNNLKTYFFTRWGTVKAVDGVSFTVERGEVLGLVGESGCGKTITCLSILRLVPEPVGRIVGGQILLEGEDLLQKSEEEMRRIRGSKISMILQDPMTSLNPVFTVGSQLTEGIRIHRGLKGKTLWARAMEMLKMVHIPSPSERLQSYPHELSGGMRQRVVGGIALSCEPFLLIADEPTTSLDATIQIQFLRLLRDLQQQSGLSLIFITHDFGIVARICDRVAVMYAGKIVETARVRDLFNHPAHPYAEALIKALPKVEEKVVRLTSIEGEPPRLHDIPPGCSFALRCSYARKQCRLDQDVPHVEIGDGHWARCWNYA
jgi:oligopeptide/dipeptide ABC transporter ATP-binding protein